MPVSHSRRCIFVHIPKCAGTSIEFVLGMHGPLSDVGLRPYWQQRLDPDTLFGAGGQHFTARRLRDELGPETWSAYFTFAVVRNPWDRVVSHAAWRDQKWHRGEAVTQAEMDRVVDTLDAEAAAGTIAHEHLHPQHGWVEDERGGIMVDRIGRFETLAVDWAGIAARIGAPTALPRRMRSVRDDYRRYFTDAQAETVGRIYARDCALFGYSF